MASLLLSPRGLFGSESDFFSAPKAPRSAPHPNKPAASPDLASLPRHTFPAPVDDARLTNLSGVTRASLLQVRPAVATVATGIAELDALTSGIPRGALTEIYGPASSGRTSVQLALLAEMTRRQEVCALVDVSDSFDPHSAAAAGVDLERVLWVRCGVESTEYRVPSETHHGDTGTRRRVPTTEYRVARDTSSRHAQTSDEPKLREFAGATIPPVKIAHAKNCSVSPCLGGGFGSQLGTRNSQSPSVSPCLGGAPYSVLGTRYSVLFRALEQALKVTDLLLQSSGFGLVAVDLGDIPAQIARRVPLTSWFRFRRAVENTPTVLLVMEQEPYAKTCASLVLKMYPQSAALRDQAPTAELPTHARLLRGVGVTAEVVRTRLERKPPRSVAAFEMQTTWTKASSH